MQKPIAEYNDEKTKRKMTKTHPDHIETNLLYQFIANMRNGDTITAGEIVVHAGNSSYTVHNTRNGYLAYRRGPAGVCDAAKKSLLAD